jgi:hypothetical protein
MKRLSKNEMKHLVGGKAGTCYAVSNGSSTDCYFATPGNAGTLCSRVYPGQVCIESLAHGDGSCGGCQLN